jgi:hypothetical protein
MHLAESEAFMGLMLEGWPPPRQRTKPGRALQKLRQAGTTVRREKPLFTIGSGRSS